MRSSSPAGLRRLGVADIGCLRANVYGRVQGVFFRAYVVKCATELRLVGYTRNLPDGSVEVFAEGERSQLEKLIDYLQKGPPAARVDKVITGWSECTGNCKAFTIRR